MILKIFDFGMSFQNFKFKKKNLENFHFRVFIALRRCGPHMVHRSPEIMKIIDCKLIYKYEGRGISKVKKDNPHLCILVFKTK